MRQKTLDYYNEHAESKMADEIKDQIMGMRVMDTKTYKK